MLHLPLQGPGIFFGASNEHATTAVNAALLPGD